jgi:nucleoside 2-deoxyribosyltransferase
MRVFVSGKVGAEGEIRSLMRTLEKRGHELTFDWTLIEHLRPYERNKDASRSAAIQEVEGVRSADALVLVEHDRGVGMFVELGVAIALGKRAYVVSGESPRTMFYFHPLVRRVASFDELLAALDNDWEGTIAR